MTWHDSLGIESDRFLGARAGTLQEPRPAPMLPLPSRQVVEPPRRRWRCCTLAARSTCRSNSCSNTSIRSNMHGLHADISLRFIERVLLWCWHALAHKACRYGKSQVSASSGCNSIAYRCCQERSQLLRLRPESGPLNVTTVVQHRDLSKQQKKSETISDLSMDFTPILFVCKYYLRAV